MLRSDLCDYADAYILIEGIITVSEMLQEIDKTGLLY